jgi:hypothetical protein
MELLALYPYSYNKLYHFSRNINALTSKENKKVDNAVHGDTGGAQSTVLYM